MALRLADVASYFANRLKKLSAFQVGRSGASAACMATCAI